MQGILTFNLEPLFCLYKKGIVYLKLVYCHLKKYFIIIDSPSSQEHYFTEVPVLFRRSLGKGNQDSWKRFHISFMLKGGKERESRMLGRHIDDMCNTIDKGQANILALF